MGSAARALGAVVVLNGARPAEVDRTRRWVARLAGRMLVVAVDGGLRACASAHLTPDLYVGDRDSSGPVPRAVPAVTYARDKAHSDLAGALVELARRRAVVIGVAGLLGGRLDHEWCNLLELARAVRRAAAVVAPTERGVVLLTRHGCRWPVRRGRTFSLLALAAPATVTLRGARWGLSRGRLAPGSGGLSNRSSGLVDLRVHRGTVALVLPEQRRRGASARGQG